MLPGPPILSSMASMERRSKTEVVPRLHKLLFNPKTVYASGVWSICPRSRPDTAPSKQISGLNSSRAKIPLNLFNAAVLPALRLAPLSFSGFRRLVGADRRGSCHTNPVTQAAAGHGHWHALNVQRSCIHASVSILHRRITDLRGVWKMDQVYRFKGLWLAGESGPCRPFGPFYH